MKPPLIIGGINFVPPGIAPVRVNTQKRMEESVIVRDTLRTKRASGDRHPTKIGMPLTTSGKARLIRA
jgi:hypothetical protein